MNIMVFFSELF